MNSFYDSKVDYQLLEGSNIKVVKYQPWQLGLFHPDLRGKMVWYPKSGTLMYENMDENINYKIGKKQGEFGMDKQFIAGGYNPEDVKPNITEDIYAEMMKLIEIYPA